MRTKKGLRSVTAATILVGAAAGLGMANSSDASMNNGIRLLGSGAEVRSAILEPETPHGDVYAGSKDSEGKCGEEDKCGEEKCGDKDSDESEGSKDSEGKCGEDTCGGE